VYKEAWFFMLTGWFAKCSKLAASCIGHLLFFVLSTLWQMFPFCGKDPVNDYSFTLAFNRLKAGTALAYIREQSTHESINYLKAEAYPVVVRNHRKLHFIDAGFFPGLY
jgi:hypothetical protein